MTPAERFLLDIYFGEQLKPNFRADVKLTYYWDDHLAHCKDLWVRVDGSQRTPEDKTFLTTVLCGHGIENQVEFKVDKSCWFWKEEY